MANEGESRNTDNAFVVWLAEYKEVSSHLSNSLSVMARLLGGYYAFNGFLFAAFGSAATWLRSLPVEIRIANWSLSFDARNAGLVILALIGVSFSFWALIMLRRFQLYLPKSVNRAGYLENSLYGYANMTEPNSIFSSIQSLWDADKRRLHGFSVGMLVICSVIVVWAIMGLGAFHI